MSNFIETRGMLSKLLATENLVVQHDVEATTASFDTDRRVLVLPVLKTEDECVYNLFVGHEVGHALLTPPNWMEDIPDDVPPDYVNVIEDIRVERHIQNKFPGLKADFRVGYDTLNEKDFFKIADEDLNQMKLIDRLNLHFKLGYRAMIPFSKEENVYVSAADRADTWEKVIEVAKMIANYIPPHNEQQSDIAPGAESNTESGNSEEKQQQTNNGAATNSAKAQTQNAFDDSLDNIIDKRQREKYVYVNVGDISTDEVITPVQRVRDTVMGSDKDGAQAYRLKSYLRSIKSEVNHMVQQFEMRKSADAYSRQQTHKTGVIDTNKLHNYKLTEDIFLKQTTVPDGKSHGMVMFLDWSGSMSDICDSTVKQVITMVQFCRKVQIPFDVYLFTSGEGPHETVDVSKAGTLQHSCVRLVQVITSSAKNSEIDKDIFHLWCGARGISYGKYDSLPFSSYFMMGGTPLNNALFLVPTIVSEFKEKTGAQKVSFVCVTDGDSGTIAYYDKVDYGYKDPHVIVRYPYYETVMVRDGSHVYPIGDDTHNIVKWLKIKLPDVALSHIFLGSAQRCERYVKRYDGSIDLSKFRKQGSASTSSKSWDVIGVMNPYTFTDTSYEMDVDAGESKARIKSALNKMLKQKSSSKVMMTHIVDQFA